MQVCKEELDKGIPILGDAPDLQNEKQTPLQSKKSRDSEKMTFLAPLHSIKNPILSDPDPLYPLETQHLYRVRSPQAVWTSTASASSTSGFGSAWPPSRANA